MVIRKKHVQKKIIFVYSRRLTGCILGVFLFFKNIYNNLHENHMTSAFIAGMNQISKPRHSR